MRRIYIALASVIISVAVGTAEYCIVNNQIDKHLKNISIAEEYAKSNKIKKAEKLSINTAKSFESFSKNILYCFYSHDELEEITEQLYRLEDLLDDKRLEDYHEQSHILRKKLLSVKEKEQLKFQNIL